MCVDIFSYLLGKKTGGGGSSDLDWTKIGYSYTPQTVVDGYNHAKTVYDSWENVSDLSSKCSNDKELIFMPLVDTSNATKCPNLFYGCVRLIEVPQLDTSHVTNFTSMFYGCTSLKTVPVFDWSGVNLTTGLSNVFQKCPNLSTQSLDNILQSCISATNYHGTKTLAQLKLTSTDYPAETIQALPHYEDFTTAGWTIGY